MEEFDDEMVDVGQFEEEEDIVISSASDAPIDVMLDSESDMHGDVLSRLVDMIRDAEQHVSQRFDDWDEVDKYNRLYIDLSAPARRGDKSTDTSKKEMPFERSVAVPMIYHIIQTRVAHNFSMLTGADPFAHLESYSSDGFRKSRLMEARLNKDIRDSKVDLAVWQALYDTERYGIAMWKLGWHETYETKQAWEVMDPPWS
jgi:hypothetical protein